MHTMTDTTVKNGQEYFYAVCAYDRGSDSLAFFPSENSIAVSRTVRGGTILPANIVEVRPEPRVTGYTPARASEIQHTGPGSAVVGVEVLDSKEVPRDRIYAIRFYVDVPGRIHASRYELYDSTGHRSLFNSGTDFHGEGRGPVGTGLLPVIATPDLVTPDSVGSGFLPGSVGNARLKFIRKDVDSADVQRPGYPAGYSIMFSGTYVDTSLIAIGSPAIPVKFRVDASSPSGPLRMRFFFHDANNDSTLSSPGDYIDLVTYFGSATSVTWRVQIDTVGQAQRGTLVLPAPGDVYHASFSIPAGTADLYLFTTRSEFIDAALSREQYKTGPYVVPNPYVGAASFEPERFAVSGRGERRMEFRGLPAGATVRIYDVRGALVQTLYHDGSTSGYVAWDLRTKDNLDVAPGLYIFHVEAAGLDAAMGKFAIIK